MKHYLKYTILIVITIFLGLQSRNASIAMPVFIADNAGDVLWTMMVYLGFRLITPNKKARFAFFAALIFSFLIEISQLYQAEWAIEFRKNRIAALIFGSGFIWIDFVRYSIGAFLAHLVDHLFFLKAEK